jgi:NAD(P)-dependent dehydrogenase (short-subunit alcohol dehydrogenase family)
VIVCDIRRGLSILFKGENIMAGRLDGKVAIVTGAASQGEGVGNGMAIAILFAREGAKVVLVNRNQERAEVLQKEIASEGGTALAYAGDMTKAADAQGAVDAAVSKFGGLNILVNNIGIGGGTTADKVSEEDWDKIMDINLKSMMLVTRAALPAMKDSGGGSIIHISSIAGARGLISERGASAYATSKAGMHGYSYSVAADFARDNIRSNVIIVGSVDTPIVAHLGTEARQRRASMVPLGTKGTGWDTAWGAVYLASDESRWVTGAQLPIDGGLIALRDWPR